MEKIPATNHRLRRRVERAIPELYAARTSSQLRYWYRSIKEMINESLPEEEAENQKKES